MERDQTGDGGGGNKWRDLRWCREQDDIGHADRLYNGRIDGCVRRKEWMLAAYHCVRGRCFERFRREVWPHVVKAGLMNHRTAFPETDDGGVDVDDSKDGSGEEGEPTTLLHLATRHHRIAFVHYMLFGAREANSSGGSGSSSSATFGVNVNQPDTHDQATALDVAAHIGSVGCARWLLRAGANPNLANNCGATPLLTAAQCGQISMIRVLLEPEPPATAAEAEAEATAALHAGQARMATAAGQHVSSSKQKLANLQHADEDGFNALLWGVNRFPLSAATVILLVERYGMDINRGDANGVTALMWAVNYGHYYLVPLLLELGVCYVLLHTHNTSFLFLLLHLPWRFVWMCACISRLLLTLG